MAGAQVLSLSADSGQIRFIVALKVFERNRPNAIILTSSQNRTLRLPGDNLLADSIWLDPGDRKGTAENYACLLPLNLSEIGFLKENRIASIDIEFENDHFLLVLTRRSGEDFIKLVNSRW